MAHYAYLNNDNIVTMVIVGKDENEIIDGLTPEQYYGAVRTSYNGNIRGTFAGIGYLYNADEDIFIAPQPYPSWTRGGSFWNPPTPMPTDCKMYSWNEAKLAWVEIA